MSDNQYNQTESGGKKSKHLTWEELVALKRDKQKIAYNQWLEETKRRKAKTPEQKANDCEDLFNCAWFACHQEDFKLWDKVKPKLIDYFTRNPGKIYPTKTFLWGVMKIKLPMKLNIFGEKTIQIFFRAIENF